MTIKSWGLRNLQNLPKKDRKYLKESWCKEWDQNMWKRWQSKKFHEPNNSHTPVVTLDCKVYFSLAVVLNMHAQMYFWLSLVSTKNNLFWLSKATTGNVSLSQAMVPNIVNNFFTLPVLCFSASSKWLDKIQQILFQVWPSLCQAMLRYLSEYWESIFSPDTVALRDIGRASPGLQMFSCALNFLFYFWKWEWLVLIHSVLSPQEEGKELQMTLIPMKNSERPLGQASRKHTWIDHPL